MHSYVQLGEKTGTIISHACAIFCTCIPVLFRARDVQIKSCVSNCPFSLSFSFSLSSFLVISSLYLSVYAKSHVSRNEVADSANKCSPRRPNSGRKVPIMFPSRRWFYSLIFRSYFYLLEFATN